MKIYPGIVICTEEAGHLLASCVDCPGDRVKLRDSTPLLADETGDTASFEANEFLGNSGSAHGMPLTSRKPLTEDGLQGEARSECPSLLVEAVRQGGVNMVKALLKAGRCDGVVSMAEICLLVVGLVV